MSSLWLCKNATHRFTWSGSAGRRGMYRDTVISLMTNPLSSSLSIRWYGRPVRLGDDDDSGFDVGETLPGSRDLWFHEMENASFDGSRRASFAYVESAIVVIAEPQGPAVPAD